MSSSVKETRKFFKSAGELKKIKRSGWLRLGIKNAESDADHSYRTALIALIFGKRKKLNEKKLLKMALIHDLSEAITGDYITEGAAKEIERNDQHEVEEKALKQILSGLPERTELMKIWMEYENQKTPEAKILKEIDKLEMLFQALEYEKEGYSKEMLDDFWEYSEKYFKTKEIKEIFVELKKQRRK